MHFLFVSVLFCADLVCLDWYEIGRNCFFLSLILFLSGTERLDCILVNLGIRARFPTVKYFCPCVRLQSAFIPMAISANAAVVLKLVARLHLTPRFSTHGSVLPLLRPSSWCGD